MSSFKFAWFTSTELVSNVPVVSLPNILLSLSEILCRPYYLDSRNQKSQCGDRRLVSDTRDPAARCQCLLGRNFESLYKSYSRCAQAKLQTAHRVGTREFVGECRTEMCSLAARHGAELDIGIELDVNGVTRGLISQSRALMTTHTSISSLHQNEPNVMT